MRTTGRQAPRDAGVQRVTRRAGAAESAARSAHCAAVRGRARWCLARQPSEPDPVKVHTHSPGPISPLSYRSCASARRRMPTQSPAPAHGLWLLGPQVLRSGFPSALGPRSRTAKAGLQHSLKSWS
eukprot:scaffold1646_cov384-Prasinococcus_capsulatus_cf.AAC.9